MTAFATLTATLYLSTVSALSARLKPGTSFTAVTVNRKLLVVVSAPSLAIKVTVALPLALVSGL